MFYEGNDAVFYISCLLSVWNYFYSRVVDWNSFCYCASSFKGILQLKTLIIEFITDPKSLSLFRIRFGLDLKSLCGRSVSLCGRFISFCGSFAPLDSVNHPCMDLWIKTKWHHMNTLLKADFRLIFELLCPEKEADCKLKTKTATCSSCVWNVVLCFLR